ncbi:response regulator, partial [Methylobacterium sp. J-070]|nr:response regulator [Methylobacterium sp. J-070]
MLSALGFDVLQAEHAHGAIQHLEANGGAALLFTDFNMPGAMDGCVLAHTVRARWPETRIIVCSGCTCVGRSKTRPPPILTTPRRARSRRPDPYDRRRTKKGPDRGPSTFRLHVAS